MDKFTAYHRLEKRFARISKLGAAAGILGWDMAVNMPPGGAEGRAEQLAVLASLRHEMEAAPEVQDWLIEAEEKSADLDAWQTANLAEMRRQWVHAAALPADLVEAMTMASADCEMAWRKARPSGDFKAIVPKMENLLKLVREQAAAKADKLDCSLYDALLDMYEPGGKSERITAIFDDLEAFLPGFLGEVLEHQKSKPPVMMPDGPFPVDKQRALGVKLMDTLGFDFDHGRLDISLHPFCGGTPDDVRITTRYDVADFTSSLMGVLHETGHGLYELGLPEKWRHQPVGVARGMSLHESQSLLMEMQACRSPEFIGYAAPLMKETFGGSGPAWAVENMQSLYTKVKPDFIRVDADEVTYPAHVILRYQLEKALIEGDMEVTDLPGAWNEGFKRLLGLTPPSDSEGCLQDIHWFDGAFGYFPT